jgi:uncharacterized protein YceK
MKKILLALVAVLLLSGCGSEGIINKDSHKTIECNTFKDFLKLDIVID